MFLSPAVYTRRVVRTFLRTTTLRVVNGSERLLLCRDIGAMGTVLSSELFRVVTAGPSRALLIGTMTKHSVVVPNQLGRDLERVFAMRRHETHVRHTSDALLRLASLGQSGRIAIVGTGSCTVQCRGPHDMFAVLRALDAFRWEK